MMMASINTNSIPQRTKQGLVELERTPEAVAVSIYEGVGAGSLVRPAPSSIPPNSPSVSRQTYSWPVEVLETAGKPSESYLDILANVSMRVEKTCAHKGWYVAGEDVNGHRFGKEIVCGKEWCTVCGENDSVAHKRRFARWLPKAQQLKVMGYFVFTLPEDLRAQYRTKTALAELGHQIQGLLKVYGYSRGLRRWHWFGDKSTKWHPHLNCLVDGGHLKPKKLANIKKQYASLLGVDLADVHYSYRVASGQMVHSLKYITRATFRDANYDMDMAVELWGFRNAVAWGRDEWKGEAVWSLADLSGEALADGEGLDIEAINSLAKGVCPECGEPIKWGKPLPVCLLDMEEKKSLGAGYYRLADIKTVPVQSAEDKQRLYWLDIIHRVEVKLAVERSLARDKAQAVDNQGFWTSLVS